MYSYLCTCIVYSAVYVCLCECKNIHATHALIHMQYYMIFIVLIVQVTMYKFYHWFKHKITLPRTSILRLNFSRFDYGCLAYGEFSGELKDQLRRLMNCFRRLMKCFRRLMNCFIRLMKTFIFCLSLE